MERIVLYFLLLIFCISCENSNVSTFKTISIPGRNGQFIYEIDFPDHWEYAFTDSNLINDTRESLCDLFFEEENEKVIFSIHNFPCSSLHERIPPKAQVNRWNNQLKETQEIKKQEILESFGGFCGIKFQGVGNLNHEAKKMIAWAMQLPEEFYHSLNFSNFSEDELMQMRADFTIKVTGPESLIDKHQATLEKVAHSFRLIQDIEND